MSRIILIVLAFAFVVTLALAAGPKLSPQASAVVIGVACGIIAGVPVSFLACVLAARLSWREGREE